MTRSSARCPRRESGHRTLKTPTPARGHCWPPAGVACCWKAWRRLVHLDLQLLEDLVAAHHRDAPGARLVQPHARPLPRAPAVALELHVLRLADHVALLGLHHDVLDGVALG